VFGIIVLVQVADDHSFTGAGMNKLTVKQITENTEAVLRGLEKKHFKNAKETIDQVIALNDKRRSTQNELDKNLAEVNSLSRTIGQLMKEGNDD
jgi:seryl-tRNA synthetase